MPTLLLLLIATLPLDAQPGRFGLPDCPGPNARLAARAGFLVCFDLHSQLPRWTAHQIARAPQRLTRPVFHRDLDLAPTLSTRHYSSTPYVRGHLVPAADLTADPAAFHDSFLMSNVAPLDPSLNSGLLLRIENAIRRLSQGADAVLVITGTVLQSTSTSSRLPVPSHIFKAVLVLRHASLEMYAVLVPNAPPQPGLPISAAATSVAHLEHLTGLDFFPNLDDELELSLQASTTSLARTGSRPHAALAGSRTGRQAGD